MAVEGGSAERKADELAGRGDVTAGAWAAGAAGERRVAAALTALPQGWTVLHDRLLRPGQSEANLDHVVVGPSGLFLVDAKNRAGRVSEWEGGLFQHTVRGEQPATVSLAGELKKVAGMAAYMAAETGMSVTPVLCLAGAHEAEFGEARMVRGVWVVPVSRLVPWLVAHPQVLDPEAMARAVVRAMTDFPSTTTDPGLLAAIGQAAKASQGARKGRRTGVPRTRTAPGPVVRQPKRVQQQRSRGRSLRQLVGAVLFLGIGYALLHWPAHPLSSLPNIPSGAGVPISGLKATPGAPPPVIKPSPAPTDCDRVSAAAVTSAIGRPVQPIATRIGCAWGTRLDDRSTMLLTIQLSAGHSAYDLELETSARQQRVVFGTDLDPQFRPATALWVATGEPIVTGRTRVMAQADTHVIVATRALGVSDDRARAMALAIAVAASRP